MGVNHEIYEGIEIKQCCKCTVWMALIDFNKSKNNKDGLNKT